MMQCPYCQTPLPPAAEECPACRLSFPRAKQLLGAVPQLRQLVADTHGLLDARAQARIRRRIEKMQRHYPQVVLQVVVHPFPEAHPFALHVFWLFNAAAFASDSRRGKNCHVVLLAVDPARGEAALMPGYGLEPYLPATAMDHLLALSEPDWEVGRWADGVERVLQGLDQLLASTSVVEEAPAAGIGEF